MSATAPPAEQNLERGVAEAPIAPTLIQAFWFWLKLGFISFGGPAGQISVMHQELVEKRRWISETRFLHALNYFTFLPSFLFIFAGGPLVESTHGDIKFTAPLTGITAAVVGVILNLAVFFAWHVLWPKASEAAPFSGRFEWATLVIGLAAFIALFRFKLDVMLVLAACGVAGLVWQFSKPMLGG